VPGPLPPCRKLFVKSKHSAETSVHDEPAYVVIRLHRFLVAVWWLCGAGNRYKLSSRTAPAYPPRAGPYGGPRSPPRRGPPYFCGKSALLLYLACASNTRSSVTAPSLYSG